LFAFAFAQFEPITVVSHRSNAGPFECLSILFQPHQILTTNSLARAFCVRGSFTAWGVLPFTRSRPLWSGCGGAAGYRPQVQNIYFECIYTHSPEGHPSYGIWISQPQDLFRKCAGFLLLPFLFNVQSVWFDPLASGDMKGGRWGDDHVGRSAQAINQHAEEEPKK